MRRSKMVVSVMLFVLTALLSGCLVGFEDDRGGGYRDGHRDNHDEGRRPHDREDHRDR
jgi:hypothetical protein